MICPDCDGTGSVAEHDPGCDAGPRCEQTCPIQAPCFTCAATGSVLLCPRCGRPNRSCSCTTDPDVVGDEADWLEAMGEPEETIW